MPKTNEFKRVAIYARVSDHRDGRQHPEIQLSELREFAARRGWRVLCEYIDHISGSKDSRPQLNRLMIDARRRKFDLVLVWKLDRLGRSLRHLLNTLEEFQAMGIGLVSMRESLDPTTPMGKAMSGMIGVMAEFERGLISERVIAGMRHAKSKGIHVGRPRVLVNATAIKTMRDSGSRLAGDRGRASRQCRHAVQQGSSLLIQISGFQPWVSSEIFCSSVLNCVRIGWDFAGIRSRLKPASRNTCFHR